MKWVLIILQYTLVMIYKQKGITIRKFKNR